MTQLWGIDNYIPNDIKRATNVREDALSRMGNFITPIFRDSIPKLVNAKCEFIHASKTSSFRHTYYARNGDKQCGYGVPDNTMSAFKRNKLARVKITYVQLDGTHYTISTNNLENGKEWHKWIKSTWNYLSLFNDDIMYRRLLDYFMDKLRDWDYGHAYFPQSIRSVVHELQCHFHEPRTVFIDPV